MTEKARNTEARSSLIYVEGGSRKTRTEKILLESELYNRSDQSSQGERETAGKIFQVEFGQDDKNQRIDTERLNGDTGELERRQEGIQRMDKEVIR